MPLRLRPLRLQQPRLRLQPSPRSLRPRSRSPRRRPRRRPREPPLRRLSSPEFLTGRFTRPRGSRRRSSREPTEPGWRRSEPRSTSTGRELSGRPEILNIPESRLPRGTGNTWALITVFLFVCTSSKYDYLYLWVNPKNIYIHLFLSHRIYLLAISMNYYNKAILVILVFVHFDCMMNSFGSNFWTFCVENPNNSYW